MRRLFAILMCGVVIGTSASAAPDTSPRPVARPNVSVKAEVPIVTSRLSTANASFTRWINGFRRRALSKGVSASTFDAAFRGVRYNTDVISRDRNQSEFTKQLWDYLDSAASPTRVKNGRTALRDQRRVLAEIEGRYGVEAEVVTAVWGLESAYGSYRGVTPVIEALATLAFDGRRGRFFEAQLIAALKIIQSGDVRASDMTGSWAGAMGHTQFIPTSYLSFAVDFRGDGQRDIWSDDPTDALASTAAYLARSGWTKGQPWGVEVRLPRGFDYTQARRSNRRSPDAWAAMGVRDMDGKRVPNYGRASILVPAGARGAAFMIFDNFAVIEKYNKADAYVIGVGHLSDRIRGGGPIRAEWPRKDRPLLNAEKEEIQRRLTRAGFSTKGIDGIIGPDTIAAIRAYQRATGLTPDGYASYDILRRLR